MDRHLPLVMVFAVLMLAILLVLSVTYIQRAYEEFNNIHVALAVDYATDAAVDSLLDASSLGLDYQDLNTFNVSPQHALDTFTKVLLGNLQMSATPENISLLQTKWVPVFAVALNDGVTIATPRDVLDGETPILKTVFSPVIPYALESGGKQTSVTLSGEYHYVLGNDFKWKKIVGSGDTIVLSQKHMSRQQYINDFISKEVTSTIRSANDKLSVSGNRANFYIPYKVSALGGSQQVKGISVIAVVQNVDLYHHRPVSVTSIGGARVGANRFVVAYQAVGSPTGLIQYCYVDQIEDNEIVETVGIFTNMREAANSGAFPDLVRLTR